MKRLRSGYTTGACAAAAAKMAAQLLAAGEIGEKIEIPFPDGSRHVFTVHRWQVVHEQATASVIKDAGDDPDVTNGAEISATVSRSPLASNGIAVGNIVLSAGNGIGIVTKPGLAVTPGEPAINPVPRQMIHEAVSEVIPEGGVYVSISIARGEELAARTLNHRLGIVGGLSVLGTTGIVRPVSSHAWTATIEASMNVAKKTGLSEIVLSTGRTSEKGVQQILNLADEAYAMMGDYLEFSLKAAKERDFRTIHLAGMWAKIIKGAMRIPQTHVRNGALEMRDAAAMLKSLGSHGELQEKIESSNTAREMYAHLKEHGREDLIQRVCRKARDYGRSVSGREVKVYLVDASAKVVEHV